MLTKSGHPACLLHVPCSLRLQILVFLSYLIFVLWLQGCPKILIILAPVVFLGGTPLSVPLCLLFRACDILIASKVKMVNEV